MQADVWLRRLWILTFATLLVRFALAALIPLYADEAYYRCWSLDLKSFYFDHPPMVAWMVAVSRALAGDGILGIRLFAPVIVAVSGMYIFIAALDAGADRRGAFMATAVFHAAPVTNAAGIIMTPDTPLLLFWTLTWYFGQKSIRENRMQFWLAAGFFCSLGILSKFTMLLILPALIAALLLSDSLLFVEWRIHRLALCILTALLIPFFLVDRQAVGASLAFQSARIGASGALLSSAEYLASHFLTLSPLLPVVLFTALLKRDKFGWREYVSEPALWFFVFPFVFFLLLSPVTRIEMNWAACAWLPLFGLAGAALSFGRDPAFERLYRKALIVACVFTVGGLLWVAFFDARISEYRDIRNLFDSGIVNQSDQRIFAQRYQDAALSAFVLRDSEREIKVLPLKKQRSSELDWSQAQPLPDDLLFLVRRTATDMPPALMSYKCTVAAARGMYRLFQCGR